MAADVYRHFSTDRRVAGYLLNFRIQHKIFLLSLPVIHLFSTLMFCFVRLDLVTSIYVCIDL